MDGQAATITVNLTGYRKYVAHARCRARRMPYRTENPIASQVAEREEKPIISVVGHDVLVSWTYCVM